MKVKKTPTCLYSNKTGESKETLDEDSFERCKRMTVNITFN